MLSVGQTAKLTVTKMKNALQTTRQTNSLYRNVLLNLFAALVLFLSNTIVTYAQPSRVEGTWANNADSYNNNIGTLTNRGGALFFRAQTAYTGGSPTTRRVLFNNASGNYSPKWTSSSTTVHSLNTYLNGNSGSGATERLINGGAQDAHFTITASRYYTFNVGGNGGGDNDWSILETSYNPVSISSVSSPPATVAISEPVTVTVTTAANPSSGEFVYVRYTNDGFASSTVVAVSMSGNSGSVNIPGQSSGTTVQYYAFTSNQSTISNASQSDWFTLNLRNATGENVVGSNFSYTVTNNYKSQANGNWNVGGTWFGGSVPPASANIIIDHNVTVTATPSAIGNLTINSGDNLTLNASTGLTINSGSTITNNGTFDLTTNAGTTITASGSLTFAGSNAVTLNNLTISGGITLTTTPTINGTLTISSGGFFNQTPNYGASSLLLYNSGGTYTTSNEWTATTDGAAGAGRPGAVQVGTTTNLTLAGSRAIAGSITINASRTLTAGGNSLIIRGSFVRNGTFSSSAGSTITMNGDGTISTGTTFQNLTLNPVVSGGSNITINTGVVVSSVFTYISGTVTNSTNLTLTNLSGQYVYSNSAGGTFPRVTYGGTTTSLTFSVNTASDITISNIPPTQTFSTLTVTNTNVSPGTITLNATANTTWTLTGSPSITVTGSTKWAITGTDASNRLVILANNNTTQIQATGTSLTTIGAWGVIDFRGLGTSNTVATSLVVANNGRFTNSSATNASSTRSTIPLATWQTGSLCELTAVGGGVTANNTTDLYINIRQTYSNLTINFTSALAGFGNLSVGSGLNVNDVFRITYVGTTGAALGIIGYNSTTIPGSDITCNIGTLIIGDENNTNAMASFSLLRVEGSGTYSTARRATFNIGTLQVGNPTNNRTVGLTISGTSGATGYAGSQQSAYVSVTGKTYVYGGGTMSVLGGAANMAGYQTAVMRCLDGLELIGSASVQASVQVNVTGTTPTGARMGLLVVGDSSAPANLNMNYTSTGRSVVEVLSNGGTPTTANNQVGIIKVFGDLNNYSTFASSTTTLFLTRSLTSGGTNNTGIVWVRRATNGSGGNYNNLGALSQTDLNGAASAASNGNTSYILLDGQYANNSVSYITTGTNNGNNRGVVVFLGNRPSDYAFTSTPVYVNTPRVDWQFGITGFNLPAFTTFNGTPANNLFVASVLNSYSTSIGILFPQSGININCERKLFNGTSFNLGGNACLALSRGTLYLGSSPMTLTLPHIIYQTANHTLDFENAAHIVNLAGINISPLFIDNNGGLAGINAVNTLDGTLANSANSTFRFTSGNDGATIAPNPNYGHIDLSTNNQTRIYSGTIGLQGNLITNTLSTHTVTGSTILFKGTGAQEFRVLNGSQNYNNITVNAGSVTTFTIGNLSVNGTLLVNTGGTFAYGPGTARTATMNTGSTLTVNGTLDMQHAAHTMRVTTANATTLNNLATNGSGSFIIYNSAGAYTVPASANYENLTVINGTKTLGGNTTVSGTLNIGDGNITSSTFSLGTLATANPNLTVGTINLQGGGSGDNATFDFGTVKHVVNLTGSLTNIGGAGGNVAVMRMRDALDHTLYIGGNVGSSVTYNTVQTDYPVVVYNSNAAQNVAAWQYAKLVFSGSGTRTLNGTTTVNNRLDADGGGAINSGQTLTFANNSNMFIGNFSIGATVALAASANVGLRYTTTRTTSNEASPTFNSGSFFDSVSLASGITVTLGSNLTLGNASNGILDLRSNSILKLNTANLTILNTGTSWYDIASPGVNNRIWINSSGSLIKHAGSVNNNGLIGTYPVGPDGFYNPVAISAMTGTPTAGTLTIGMVNGKHPLTGTNAMSAYWNLTATNLGTYAADISFGYDGANSPTGQVTGTQANYIGRFLATGGTWNNAGASGVSTAGTNPFVFTGATSLTGAFTMGEAGAFPTQFYYSRNTGNTNVNTNWSLTSHTVNNAPAQAPGATDFVIIGNSHTMTVPTGQSFTVASTTINASSVLDLGTTTGNALGDVAGTGTLRFTVATGSPSMPTGNFSQFTSPTGGTISYIGAGSYQIPTGFTSYNNLTIDGGGIKTLTGADITVNNILSIGSGSATQFNSQNNITFTRGGVTALNTNTNGTFNQTAGGIVLNGNGNFTISGNNLNFNHITIEDPAYLTIDPTSRSFNVAGNITINSNYPLAFNYANGTSRIIAATAATFTGTTTIGGTGTGLIDFGNIVVNTTATVTLNRSMTTHASTFVCNGTFNQTAGTFTLGNYSGGSGQNITFSSTGGTPSLTFNNLTHGGGNSITFLGINMTVNNNYTDGSTGGINFIADAGSYTLTVKNLTQTGNSPFTVATPAATNSTHSLRLLGNWNPGSINNASLVATGSGFTNQVNVFFMGTTGTMTVGPGQFNYTFNNITHTEFGIDGVTPTSAVVWSGGNAGFPWSTNKVRGNFSHNSASDFTVTGAGTFAFNSGATQTLGGTGSGNLTLNCLAVDGNATVLNLGKNLFLNGTASTTNQVQMTTLYIGVSATIGGGSYATPPNFNVGSNTVTLNNGGMLWNQPGTAATFNTGTGTVNLYPAGNTNMILNGSMTFNTLNYVPNGGTLSATNPATYTFNGPADFGSGQLATATGVNTININNTFRTANTSGLNGGAFNGGTLSFNFGTGSTVEYYATANQTVSGLTSYRNVLLSGAGIKTLSNTDLTTAGNFTINSGITFNLSTAARIVTINGNLDAGSATIDASAQTHTINLAGATNQLGTFTTSLGFNPVVNYSSSGAQTMFGSANYRSLTISGGGTKTMTGNITASGTLTMTSGNVDMGNFNMQMGVSAAALGTLTYTSGRFLATGTGSFTRWFGTTGLPTSAVAAGRFPVGTSTSNRTAFVYFSSATGLSTAGSISLTHTNVIGDQSVNFSDGGNQIDRRSQSSWALTTQNMVLGTGTVTLTLEGTGAVIVNAGQAANVRLVRSGDAIGTHLAGTGTDANPVCLRQFTSLAQLANTFYIGGSNTTLANAFINAVASGAWSSNSTWDCNCTPSAISFVTIGSSYNVNLTANGIANTLTVGPTASLDMSTYKLTLSSGGGATIQGTVLTANSNGLTGGVNAAFDNTNSPTITIDNASTVNYNGDAGTAQTITALNYGNLTISGSRANDVVLASGSIGVAGVFAPTATFTSGGYVNTGNTINFSASTAQSIPAFAYNNLTNTGNGARTLANTGVISIAGTYTPSTGTNTVTGSTVDFIGSGQTVPYSTYNNLTISGSSVSFPGSAGTFTILGTYAPNASSYTNTSNTTFNFASSGAQTIPAFNYQNLTSSNTGDRTLAAGTIGVAGTFTEGSNTYTVTGSTVNYNGTTAQTIRPITYNNLIISGTKSGNITLAAGTITVTGAFTSSATTTGYTTTGNTFVFNNSTDQNLTLTGATSPFIFNNLTINCGSSKLTMIDGDIQIITNTIFTSGNVWLGNNNVTLGNSGNINVLSRASGSNFVTNGTGFLYRWYSNSTPNCDGQQLFSTPTNYCGLNGGNTQRTIFNLGSTTGGNRWATVYPYAASVSFTQSGRIGVRYVEANGLTSIPGYTDGPSNNVTVNRRSNGYWVVTTADGIASSQTFGLSLLNSNQSFSNAANCMLIDDSGAPITSTTAVTGNNFSMGGLYVTRIGLTIAQLTNKNYYQGGNSADLINILTANGSTDDWGLTTTWDGGTVPGSGDDAIIPTGKTISLITGPTFDCRSVTVQTGATLDLGTNQLTTATTTSPVVVSGTLRTARAQGLYTAGGTGAITGSGTSLFTFNTGSTVEYYSNSAQVITPLHSAGCCAAMGSYHNLVTSGTGSRSFGTGVGNLQIAGTFTDNGTNTWTAAEANSTVVFTTGNQTIPAARYFNLTFGTGTKTLATNTDIYIAGTLTATGTVVTTGSHVIFNGSGAQTIKALNYNNLTITGTRTVNTSITLDNSATMGINGTFTYNASLSGTGTFITSGSTVDYTSSGPQTIAPIDYNNLTNSGNGDRTLSSTGTIGIYNNFSRGNGNYTIANSTVNFNGAAGQTIPAGDYFNLTVNVNSTRILANSGTINVAGTFTPGTSAYTISGSTINYNGGDGQTIAGFRYNNLSSTNNSRTIANGTTVEVVGTFTPGSGVYTAAGSTVLFSGNNQNIPAISGGYNNLTINGTGTQNLTGTVNIAAGANLTLTAGTVNNSTNNFDMGAGATIIRTGGTLSAQPVWNSNVNLTYNAVVTTGPEVPTSSSILNAMVVNPGAGNTVTLGSSPVVNGVLTLTTGRLAIGANTLTLNGTTSGSGQITGSASGSMVIGGNTGGNFGTLSFGPNTGDRVLNNLTINRTGGAGTFTLGSNLDVTGSVTFGGAATCRVLTGGNTLNLGTTGSLSGEGNGKYVVGNVNAQRTLNDGSTNFGNIGATVFNCANCNMGAVTVTRRSGAGVFATGYNSNQSVNRRYNIVPASQPASPVGLTLTWLSDDDNYGTPGFFSRVWKSTDNGVTWTRIGDRAQFSSRNITVTTSSFSEWTVADDNNPLPVELSVFNGVRTGNHVKLNWSTASEKDNKGFKVERSLDGVTFEAIGFVNGNGTTSTTKVYDFVDHQQPNEAFYRLRQQDFNGAEELSTPVKVGGLGSEVKPTLVLNPATRTLSVIHPDIEVNLLITDASGKQVLAETIRTNQPVQLPANLPVGIYHARMVTAGASNTQKIKLD